MGVIQGIQAEGGAQAGMASGVDALDLPVGAGRRRDKGGEEGETASTAGALLLPAA